MICTNLLEHASFGEQDIHLLREGSHARLYRLLGGHAFADGTRFAVWAPNAQAVSVIGDFNGWSRDAHPAAARGDGTGVWEARVPGARPGQAYKFAILTGAGAWLEKADPFARRSERPPATGSVIHDGIDYAWGDEAWMRSRAAKNAHDAPMSIYEIHLGSWRRGPTGQRLSYREIADALGAEEKTVKSRIFEARRRMGELLADLRAH